MLGTPAHESGPVFFQAMDGRDAENAGAFFGAPRTRNLDIWRKPQPNDGWRTCRKCSSIFRPGMDGRDAGLSPPSLAYEALGLLPGENAGAFSGEPRTRSLDIWRKPQPNDGWRTFRKCRMHFSAGAPTHHDRYFDVSTRPEMLEALAGNAGRTSQSGRGLVLRNAGFLGWPLASGNQAATSPAACASRTRNWRRVGASQLSGSRISAAPPRIGTRIRNTIRFPRTLEYCSDAA